MDFTYLIIYHTQSGGEIERTGTGVFHPGDASFRLEHMLWLMAEEFGRPSEIEIHIAFAGESHGETNTPKRLKAS